MTETPSHLFVVGPSRSGTALARSVLNAHPDIFLAGETHWFDDLRTTIHDPTAPMSVDMRQRVEDHFLSLADKPFGHGSDLRAGWLGEARVSERICRLVFRRVPETGRRTFLRGRDHRGDNSSPDLPGRHDPGPIPIGTGGGDDA